MAKGLFAGNTNYSNQSFDDVIDDLKKEKADTKEYLEIIEKYISTLKKNGYWNKKVPNSFKAITSFSLGHYKSTITELNDIIPDLKNQVGKHHIKRLKNIAKVADEINGKIGIVWHQQYDYKDYGQKDFNIVENVYAETRDMAASLLDIENMALRLEDFIGRKTKETSVKPKRTFKTETIVGVSTVVLALLGFLFGDNVISNFTQEETNEPTSNIKISETKQDENPVIETIKTDKEIRTFSMVYLQAMPILDNGIFVKYSYNDFLFGGVNLENVKINSRARNGEKLELMKEDDGLRISITDEPYLEFEYKSKFYSIQVLGKHYSFEVKLKEIVEPTLRLLEITDL